MRRTTSLLIVWAMAAVLWTPGFANAGSITPSTPTVGLGTTVIDLILDPEGASAGAWLVVLSGSGLSIDSIAAITPVGTDCSGLVSAMSFDGLCAAMPLDSSAVVAQVTITAFNVGDTLSLVSGNLTDFNTFDDSPFSPGVLVTVVPEPGTAVLMFVGLAGLAMRGERRRSMVARRSRRHPVPLFSALGLVVGLGASAPALASEGVREINQTCALQTGCFPGDTPGFPVTLIGRASYRLTGNLSFNSVLGPPSMPSFISIEADHAQLDLNGFSISCSNVLTGQPCTGSSTTNGISVSGDWVRILNGSIRGIPGDAIYVSEPDGVGIRVEDVRMSDLGGRGIFHLGSKAYIRNSTVSNCGGSSNGFGTGIEVVGSSAVVVGNVVKNCASSGFSIGSSSHVQDNISTFNGDHGFLVRSDSLVQGNTASSNGTTGFRLNADRLGSQGGSARANLAISNRAMACPWTGTGSSVTT